MKIRNDLFGCVFVDGYRLFAGDNVPQESSVADWLLSEPSGTFEMPVSEEPAGSTEIVVVDDEEITGDGQEAEHEESESESIVKPTRADSKADWYAFAESQGAIEQGATIDDYSKADLVELVG